MGSSVLQVSSFGSGSRSKCREEGLDFGWSIRLIHMQAPTHSHVEDLVDIEKGSRCSGKMHGFSLRFVVAPLALGGLAPWSSEALRCLKTKSVITEGLISSLLLF